MTSPVASRHAVPFIVFTIFIDAVGFGSIMPVLPKLVMDVVDRVDQMPPPVES